MLKAQEWLESQKEYNTKVKRAEIEELDVSSKDLAGSLDLSDFVNLIKLNCGDNKLTKLVLTGLTKLKKIDCYNNYLTSFDYSSLDPEKLTHLNISDNNLPEQDLSVFNNFVNLELLWIGGDDQERIEQGIYNRFHGSLEPLKNLTRLENLYISNTDIDSGLEYLPESLEKFYYSTEERPASEVGKIYEQFSLYNHDIKVWREEEFNNWIKNAQNYFDKYYPQEKRAEIEELEISFKSLEGDLKLENFTNLEKLNCSQNQLTSLDLNDCVNLKKLDCSSNQLTSLKINNLTNLQELDCRENKLVSLDCSNCPQLSQVKCDDNKLRDLNLTNCPNITWLNCYNNSLTSLNFLQDLSSEKLEILLISSNDFPPSDLTFFNKFINLRELGLFKNDFFGSLESLQNLTKLEYLNIRDTNVSEGLEYLPDSIERLWCSAKENPKSKVKVIEQELRKFGEPSGNGNFALLLGKWRENETNKELSQPSKRGKKSNLEGIDISPLIPISLNEKLKKRDELAEKYSLEKGGKIVYEKIIHEIEIESDSQLTIDKDLLPIRLYDINEQKIVNKENTGSTHYAILSYVWGKPGELSDSEESEMKELWKKSKVGYINKLNPAGYKSLKKAIKTLEFINKKNLREPINYLWMDQLCINQENNEEGLQERKLEVPKMGQYYGNAAVTLISMPNKLYEKEQLDIIEKIIRSTWFTRSWTFQEGWLSKHTIFMFDDKLVDGRSLATKWASDQPAYSDYASINLGESAKIATPLGWVHYKDKDGKGYGSEDKLILTLSQALRGIKERGRSMSIDGIYSVLGLLPYGEKVMPKYKGNLCEECKKIESEQKKAVICKHPEEQRTEWPTYFKEELEGALFDVMKVAWANGYGEALAWHGEGSNLVPRILSTEKGTTSIVGGIFIRRKESNLKTDFTPKNIKISGSKYTIDSVAEEVIEMESGEGFLIDGGLCTKDVWLKSDVEDKCKKAKYEKVKLWGTRETLKKIKKEHVLIIPSNKEWESNLSFAILAEKKDGIYHRLGLVEIRNGAENLRGEIKEGLMVNVNGNKEELPEQEMDNSLSTQYSLENLDKQIKEKQIELENAKNNVLKVQEELNMLEEKKEQLQAQIQV